MIFFRFFLLTMFLLIECIFIYEFTYQYIEVMNAGTELLLERKHLRENM